MAGESAAQATPSAAPEVAPAATETPAAAEVAKPKTRVERKLERREASKEKTTPVIEKVRLRRVAAGKDLPPVEGRAVEEDGSPAKAEPAAVVPPEPEAPAPEAKPAPPGETIEERELRLARGFSALTRDNRKAKERRLALEAREKVIAEREKEAAEFEKLKKENPYEAAKRLGLTVEELAKRALEPAETPEQAELRAVREELAAMKAEREAEKAERAKMTEAEKAAAEERAHREGTADLTSFIDEHADSVPFVKAWGKEQVAADIWAFMLSHYKETKNPATGRGEVLDRRKLLLQYETELKKRFPTPQGQGSTPARTGAAPAVNSETQEASRLTNQDAGTRASPAAPPKTEREVRAALAKKIRRV